MVHELQSENGGVILGSILGGLSAKKYSVKYRSKDKRRLRPAEMPDKLSKIWAIQDTPLEKMPNTDFRIKVHSYFWIRLTPQNTDTYYDRPQEKGT